MTESLNGPRATLFFLYLLPYFLPHMNVALAIEIGGMSLMVDNYWTPLRAAVQPLIFPPYTGSVTVRPAVLGETVVPTGSTLLGLSGKVG